MYQQPHERTINILLVEDNPGDIRLTKEACKDCPFTIEMSVVRRGSEALDFLSQRGDFEDAFHPDFVLLDFYLPTMSAYDIIEKIEASAELEAPPVVILTESKTHLEMRKYGEESVVAYLRKPIDSEELTELVHSLTESHR